MSADRLAEFHKRHQEMHVHFRNGLTKEGEESAVWLAVNAVPYLIEQIDTLTDKAHAATNEYAALLIAERGENAKLRQDCQALEHGQAEAMALLLDAEAKIERLIAETTRLQAAFARLASGSATNATV